MRLRAERGGRRPGCVVERRSAESAFAGSWTPRIHPLEWARGRAVLHNEPRARAELLSRSAHDGAGTQSSTQQHAQHRRSGCAASLYRAAREERGLAAPGSLGPSGRVANDASLQQATERPRAVHLAARSNRPPRDATSCARTQLAAAGQSGGCSAAASRRSLQRRGRHDRAPRESAMALSFPTARQAGAVLPGQLGVRIANTLAGRRERISSRGFCGRPHRKARWPGHAGLMPRGRAGEARRCSSWWCFAHIVDTAS